ncbi:MAG TPA: histidine kinase [Solirubrobacterales bacterium]|nr:histidine kinase [Solirubrobacterales bacterium]
MAAAEVKQGPEPARWERRLLPGSMVDGPGARRSLRDWGVDALVTIVALAVGLVVLHAGWKEHLGTGHASEATAAVGGALPLAIDIVLGCASLAALWVRRRHPVGVAAFVVAASAISALSAGAALVALFNVAIRCDRRTLGWTALGSLAASVVYALIYTHGPAARDDIVVSVLLIGFAVGWGLFVRVRRDLVDSLRERAARLEEEGRLRVEQARAAERGRIAREMHDVLAHRLSLLSLHAGALEFRPGAPPAEVAATAGVVREAAAAALEELRDVVGVLREGTDGETRRPQPTLADLPTLVEESRAAGARIEATLDLPAEAEDGGGAAVGRTAFRIVQEGLTNARKHAPGASVRVRVSASEDDLTVEVRNRAPLVPVLAPALPGAGCGLIGLGERVELVGGELCHGIADDGDFVLAATLPWERRE